MRKSFTVIEILVLVSIVLIVGGIVFGAVSGNGSFIDIHGNYESSLEGHRVIKNWETGIITHHPNCGCGK